MTMRSKVSAMGLLVCVFVKPGFLLIVSSVPHLPRLVCEALRIVLRIGAIEFSCVRILQIVWSRRLGTVPAGLSSIQHEDPGAWAAQRKHPVVGVGEDPMPIPVLGCPRVGHELSDLPDVLLAAAVFRCPDDVDPEARIVHGRKNSSLSLLRAPRHPRSAHAAASARRRASSNPKFLALSRFARASASSRAYRYVPGCLAAQRSPDVREAKKKTKLQNVAITLAADVSKSRASGNRNETTAFSGSADSISSGVRTSWTSSPVSGSGDTTRARFPKISGMKRLSHAHQVHRVRPNRRT